MTAAKVARMLGVGASTIGRLAKKVLGPSAGAPGALRNFTPDQVARLRDAIGERHRGEQPGLYLAEVARRVGCKPHTLARLRGKDLPPGRWVTHPRRGWVFTSDEVEDILARL
jgi:hypothetical protein